MKVSLSSEIIANHIVKLLEGKLWQQVARKKIQLNAPHVLTRESTGIMNDFTVVALNKNIKTPLRHVADHPLTLKENYIVGTSKLIQNSRTNSQKPSELSMKKGNLKKTRVSAKNRVKTFGNIELKRQIEQKPRQEQKHHKNIKSVFFKLTNVGGVEEETIDQQFRASLESDIQFARNIEQKRKQLEEQRQQRRAYEIKRFREMKDYTYDFQGRLISTGKDNVQNQTKVVNIRSQLPEEYKSRSISPSRKGSRSKISQITDTRLINLEKTPTLDILQQKIKKKKEKERLEEIEKRKASYNKYVSKNKFTNLFNKDTRVQVGVTITNLQNQEAIKNKEKDKTDTKLYSLREYKEYSKQVQEMTVRRNLKIRKNYTQQHHPRTEGNQSGFIQMERMRIKTQGAERSDKRGSSFGKTGTGTARGRGTIRVHHQSLYSENFSPSKHQ